MGWLDRFRAAGAGNSRSARQPDFSAPNLRLGEHLIADVHCHIVPGVDDGAANMEESLAMIGHLRNLGYRRSVLTSHIHSEIYPNSQKTLEKPFLDLQEAVHQHFPDYELYLAAEYFMDDHFEACIASNELLWFPARDENGLPVRCVLFEFGFHEAPINHHQVLFDLQMAGYTPVLAHAERYPYWHRDGSEIETLRERGVWITVNAASLAGNYGPETYQVAHNLLTSGAVQMICSDAHGPRHLESIESIGRSPEVQRWIQSTAPLNREAGIPHSSPV